MKYELKLICSMCGKQYGSKPNTRPNEKSHGFCGRNCVKDYYIKEGLDPTNFLEKERDNGQTA